MWDCVPDPWQDAALTNACSLATRDFTLARSSRLLGDPSCSGGAGGDRRGELTLAVVCSVFLAMLVPPALILNLGVAAVNLCGGPRVLAAIAGRTAPPPPPPRPAPSPPPSPASPAERQPSAVDVYAASAALANALQLSVVLAQLSGLAHDGGARAWGDPDPAAAAGPRRAYGCTAAYALFHVSALAAAYSVATMAFDAYLEAALPAGARPPLVEARSAPHVCAFLWGGSCLAAFPAALQVGCSERGRLDCAALGVRELADASLLVAGFAVPAAGCCVAGWCGVRLLSAAGGGTPGGGGGGGGGAEERAERRGALRAALSAALAHFSLWAPLHACVAAGLFAAVRRRPLFRTLKAAAQMVACAAAFAGPCAYARGSRRGLEGRARRLAAAVAARYRSRRRRAQPSAPPQPLAEIV